MRQGHTGSSAGRARHTPLNTSPARAPGQAVPLLPRSLLRSTPAAALPRLAEAKAEAGGVGAAAGLPRGHRQLVRVQLRHLQRAGQRSDGARRVRGARVQPGSSRGAASRGGTQQAAARATAAARGRAPRQRRRRACPSMPKAAMVRMLVKASDAVWLAPANVSSSLLADCITTCSGSGGPGARGAGRRSARLEVDGSAGWRVVWGWRALQHFRRPAAAAAAAATAWAMSRASPSPEPSSPERSSPEPGGPAGAPWCG